ncbi:MULTISPECIES: restriction endonuclease subunit S [Fusobacterium]|uniref:restriction endonuclease subunit S n=1 Tax=Fusobacterium TaxID=848 RepID=UPI0030813AA7
MNEKLQNVQWGKYRIGDLFDIDDWSYGKNKNWISRSEIKTKNGLPVISGITINNGVNYYTNDIPNDNEIFYDSLTISTRGEYSGTVTYHQGKFVLANNILVMEIKELTKNQKLFIGTLINNLSYGGYSAYPTKESLKNDSIQLPTKNGEIDFDFMDAYISELEEERISELVTYLKISDLDNYELSKDEKQVIKDFSNIKWKDYQIGKLFKKIKTKKLPYKAKNLPKEPMGEYILPVLTSSFMNQGLNYYIPKAETTILKNVISIPSNSDVYRAYYQSREFTVLSDAYAIEWKDKEKNIEPNEYLFTVSSINKVTDLPIYSYKNKLGGWNVVKNKYIKLPVNSYDEIDFEYMKKFIQAIKKLVIKDVVLYADKKIKVTKKVVENN